MPTFPEFIFYIYFFRIAHIPSKHFRRSPPYKSHLATVCFIGVDKIMLLRWLPDNDRVMRFAWLFSSLSSFYDGFFRNRLHHRGHINCQVCVDVFRPQTLRSDCRRIWAKIISDFAHMLNFPPYLISVFRHPIAKYRILFASILMSKMSFRFDGKIWCSWNVFV